MWYEGYIFFEVLGANKTFTAKEGIHRYVNNYQRLCVLVVKGNFSLIIGDKEMNGRFVGYSDFFFRINILYNMTLKKSFYENI